MPSSRPTAVLALLGPFLGLLGACEAPPDPFGGQSVPEPEIFAPEAISSEGRDYGITFSPDGLEAYFTRRGPGRRSRPQIYVSRFEEGAWSRAEPAPFTNGWEESPFLTADGGRLIYASRRDVPGWGPVRGNSNLWMVERRAEGRWSAPQPLPGDVNQPRLDEEDAPPRSEAGPVILADGTLLYWTNEDDERSSDLYAADPADDGEGGWVNPRPLRLNTPGIEMSPALSPDGRWLVFQGDRDAFAIGEDELYVSERTEYGWSEPRLLPPPINTPRNEGYPSFSPDGRYFFFASDRHSRNGYWSIYWVETEALGLGRKTEGP